MSSYAGRAAGRVEQTADGVVGELAGRGPPTPVCWAGEQQVTRGAGEQQAA